MALDIFAQFATDETKEEDGVWVELSDDAAILVARSGNKKYSKMIAREYEKNKKILDGKNDVADAKSEEIMIEVLAKTILLGWRNIQFKGEELPYSLENAKMLLKVKDFRKLVGGYADDSSAFKMLAEEEVVKN